MDTTLGMQGTGVQATSIQQIRDALLDGQMRDESSVGGYWTSNQNALENAQAQLGQFLNISGTGDTLGRLRVIGSQKDRG